MTAPIMVTVTGTFLRADGSPQRGSVAFTPVLSAAEKATPAIITQDRVEATLDANGHFSVMLYASDDPNWQTTGPVLYKVRERLDGQDRTYRVYVPSMALHVDLTEMLPEDCAPNVATVPVGGQTGPMGPQGPSGPQGLPGVAGPQGPSGTSINVIDGGAVATATLLPVTGNSPGDARLVIDTGELWVWSALTSTWNNLGRVQGPKGDDGTSVTIVGSVPTATNLPQTSNPGDGYIAVDTGHLHVWSGTQWTDVGEIRGPEGPTGPQGSTGPAGVQGPAGVSGPAGPVGSVGPAGPQGAIGPAGPVGPAGPKGGVVVMGKVDATNPLPSLNLGDGALYIAGDTVPAGGWPPNLGNTKPGDGLVWNGTAWVNVGQVRGPQGVQGVEGPVGPIGQRGLQGAQGSVGPVGPQGIQGPIGNVGPQGVQGIRGERGPSIEVKGTVPGPANLPVTGNPGDTYFVVSTGDLMVYDEDGTWHNMGHVQGPVGPPGAQGTAGATGPQGVPGADGAAGATGATGPQGTAGAKGDPGAAGPTGPPGPKGDKGDTGAGVTIRGTVDSGTPLPVSVSAGDMFIAGLTVPTAGWPGGLNPQPGNGLVFDGTKWTDVGPIRGPQGPQGPSGAQGNPGADGAAGAAGPAGAKGDTGPLGPQGPAGPPGPKGDPQFVVEGTVAPADLPVGAFFFDTDCIPPTIPVGPAGPPGPKGDTGPAGPPGPKGDPGTGGGGTGLPPSTATDDGSILTVNAQGVPVWEHALVDDVAATIHRTDALRVDVDALKAGGGGGGAAPNEVVVSDTEPTDPAVEWWIDPSTTDAGAGSGGAAAPLALDALTDVTAPAATPANKVLGTTAEGVWGPVDGLPPTQRTSPPHGSADSGKVLTANGRGVPTWTAPASAYTKAESDAKYAPSGAKAHIAPLAAPVTQVGVMADLVAVTIPADAPDGRWLIMAQAVYQATAQCGAWMQLSVAATVVTQLNFNVPAGDLGMPVNLTAMTVKRPGVAVEAKIMGPFATGSVKIREGVTTVAAYWMGPE